MERWILTDEKDRVWHVVDIFVPTMLKGDSRYNYIKGYLDCLSITENLPKGLWTKEES